MREGRRATGRRMVIGLGNESRGDDGVGPAVIRRLRRLAPAEVSLHAAPGDALELMDLWEGAEAVVLVDAVASGLPPGSVVRLAAGEVPARRGSAAVSTHGLRVGQVLRLADALGRLPPRLVLLGVEGARFHHGRGLSPPVAQAVERVARIALEELDA